jgi:uncharacterized membrane protein
MPLHFNWHVELHPITAHFPVALLCLAFLFDVIGWLRKSQSLRLSGLYCLAAGAIGTVLTIVSGLITPEAREREGGEILRQAGGLFGGFFSGRRVDVHAHWAYVLLVLALLWFTMRLLTHFDKLRAGVAMSVGMLTLAVLLVTGYYGGELVYGRRERAQTFNDDSNRVLQGVMESPYLSSPEVLDALSFVAGEKVGNGHLRAPGQRVMLISPAPRGRWVR